MAKISSYARDLIIQDTDKWIGTDGPTGITKNFTAQGIADNFNTTGKISAGGQQTYKFYSGSVSGRETGSISLPDSTGGTIPFSTITDLVFSKINLAGKTITNYLEYLEEKYIFIFETSNINNFAKYRLTDITNRFSQVAFLDIEVEFVEGQGSFEPGKLYSFIEKVTLVPSVFVDKSFFYIQESASDTWVITHNLDKRPSVTVVDSGSSVVYGNTTYNGTNQVTINFSAPFSGVAYLN